MTTHTIPVRRLARIEWAESGPFIYGIDNAGNVFRFVSVPHVPNGHSGALARFRSWLATL